MLLRKVAGLLRHRSLQTASTRSKVASLPAKRAHMTHFVRSESSAHQALTEHMSYPELDASQDCVFVRPIQHALHARITLSTWLVLSHSAQQHQAAWMTQTCASLPERRYRDTSKDDTVTLAKANWPASNAATSPAAATCCSS